MLQKCRQFDTQRALWEHEEISKLFARKEGIQPFVNVSSVLIVRFVDLQLNGILKIFIGLSVEGLSMPFVIFDQILELTRVLSSRCT